MISRRAQTVIMVSIAFQLLWFALVSTAGSTHSVAVSLATLGGISLLTWRYGNDAPLDARFVLLATALGLLVDTALIAAGVLAPARSVLPFPLAPLWLIALWALFAMFLRIVLTYLQSRHLMQLLVGGIGGPMAYWSGVRLGAVSFPGSTLMSLGILSVTWALVCVLFFRLSARIGIRKGAEA